MARHADAPRPARRSTSIPQPGFGTSSLYNLITYGSEAGGTSPSSWPPTRPARASPAGTVSATGYYYHDYNVALVDSGSRRLAAQRHAGPGGRLNQWASTAGGTWGTTCNWTRNFAAGGRRHGPLQRQPGHVRRHRLRRGEPAPWRPSPSPMRRPAIPWAPAAAANSLIIDDTASGGTGSIAVAAGTQYIQAPRATQ